MAASASCSPVSTGRSWRAMSQPYVLAETTWTTVQSTRYDIAVLPWGATEAHNRHLPYGTDTIQCQAIATAAAGLAWAAGARVLVLPAVPFGVQTGQRDIPFCLNLNPSTQTEILRDLFPSLDQHGVRKLVILNGHGGNDFRQIIRELSAVTAMLLCQVNWYAMIDPGPYFAEPGDHAGELETSVMLHLAAPLVLPLAAAGPGTARAFAVEGFRQGWAWTPRQWTAVTDDTGVGNPAAATAAKGSRYIEAVTQRLAGFLVELGGTELDAMYTSHAKG